MIVIVGLSGCGSSPTERPAANGAPGGTGGAAEWFTERAEASGFDFVHFNGMSGELYYPEIMAPGVALLDYDNDGDLDVYVVQGQMLGAQAAEPGHVPAEWRAQGSAVPKRSRRERGRDAHAAFHGRDRPGRHRHPDRTAWVWRPATSTTTGASDIYRTGLDGSVMLRNNGDGTFTDVTRQTGTEDRGGWGVSAAFVDYDRDGWLDLFVGNYLIYSLEADVHCLSVTGQRDYCPPNSYRAQPSRLYHNRGNGTFEDVTSKALVGGAYGPALGVSTADFNGDGWIDIYVANDGEPNQLWINQHNGTFKETAFTVRRGGERRRQRRSQAWAWTPAISTTTATKICSSPTGSTR